MKFTTITYDANLPTVQQVNVPTNSDYKVGMKVKRNGEVQRLTPSDFTVYTGEVNVIPPTDWEGAAVSVENASSTIFVAYAPAVTEELNGKKVKAKDLRFEASYDSGATWEEVSPLGFVSYLKINDKSAGTNNFVAQMDPRENKWYLLSGGQVVGEALEITMPLSALQVQIVTNSSGWGFKSFPCQFRVVLPYGGYEERVTYPVDPEKTNGYVTITKASGDDASFKQYGVTVDADKTYAVNEYVGTQQGPTNGPLVVMDIDLSHLAGTTITPDQLFLAVKQGKSTDTEPASREELEALLEPYMQSTMPNMHWALGDGSRLVNPSGSQIMFYEDAIMRDNFRYFGWKEGDAPIFLVNNVGESSLYTLTSFTIEDGAHLIFRCNALAANRYAAALFKLLPQEAIHADFKLNINEFKSQSGDIAETLADGSSVKVDGTYADGTAFSFDFCTK